MSNKVMNLLGRTPKVNFAGISSIPAGAMIGLYSEQAKPPVQPQIDIKA